MFDKVGLIVCLSNHFLEDLEKLANIYKRNGRHDWQEILMDDQEFKTRYSTSQMIENDISAEKRKKGLRK